MGRFISVLPRHVPDRPRQAPTHPISTATSFSKRWFETNGRSGVGRGGSVAGMLEGYPGAVARSRPMHARRANVGEAVNMSEER